MPGAIIRDYNSFSQNVYNVDPKNGAKYSVGVSMYKKSEVSQRYKILDISRDAINTALTEAAFADKNHLKNKQITKLDDKKQELTAVKADFDSFKGIKISEKYLQLNNEI